MVSCIPHIGYMYTKNLLTRFSMSDFLETSYFLLSYPAKQSTTMAAVKRRYYVVAENIQQLIN